jgi:yecA family protein
MVQEISTCSYDQLEQKLHAAAAESGAAEAHGLLCGAICAGGKVGPAVWLEHLLGEDNTLSAAAQDCSDMMISLQTDIVRQFHDDALGFELLLPAEDEPLAQRTDALGHWCAGFLYGLALGGIREDADLPDTVSEIMKDFYEISHARFAYEVTDDTDEEAYMEIVEYVRMSVLLLHAELQPMPASARLQ